VEEDPDRPSAIRTIRGAGYMFVPLGRKQTEPRGL
jgi:DNA-binding response OmpR family regulator